MTLRHRTRQRGAVLICLANQFNLLITTALAGSVALGTRTVQSGARRDGIVVFTRPLTVDGT